MKPETSLDSDLKRLRAHYDSLAKRHGYGPAAVQQSSVESQECRLRRLAEIGGLSSASILDFGCGAAHLLDVLIRDFHFEGAYTGYDLSEELIKLARDRHPQGFFENRDIFSDGVGGNFDYAFISGVFNNRVSDNLLFIRRTLETLFPAVSKGIAFNLLSRYVDYQDPALYYADPEAIFRYCKETLSPAVTLRHDYEVKAGVVPFEFTVYVYRSSHRPRTKQID